MPEDDHGERDELPPRGPRPMPPRAVRPVPRRPMRRTLRESVGALHTVGHTVLDPVDTAARALVAVPARPLGWLERRRIERALKGTGQRLLEEPIYRLTQNVWRVPAVMWALIFVVGIRRDPVGWFVLGTLGYAFVWAWLRYHWSRSRGDGEGFFVGLFKRFFKSMLTALSIFVTCFLMVSVMPTRLAIALTILLVIAIDYLNWWSDFCVFSDKVLWRFWGLILDPQSMNLPYGQIQLNGVSSPLWMSLIGGEIVLLDASANQDAPLHHVGPMSRRAGFSQRVQWVRDNPIDSGRVLRKTAPPVPPVSTDKAGDANG